MALPKQTLHLTLAGGLETKGDKRAGDARQLDICRDVQFDELGGAQTRRPFAAMSNAILGGGTLANCRRIDVVNDELIVFTADEVYTWNAQQEKWMLRGTHLAVAVDERTTCASTGDQIEGDRAELAGTIVYAWTEGATVFAAAIDKTTGAFITPPTVLSTAVGRPRLVALATKILLFVNAGSSNLTVRAIDPATPGAGISGAGTTVTSGAYNLTYDVVKVDGQDLCVGAHRRSVTTSYSVFTVTPGLVVTSATKARTCDGPIAVATTVGGTQTQVVRGNAANIQGDLLTTSTLADVFTGQAIGTASNLPVNQIAVAFASTTAHVFWSAREAANGTSFETKRNTVTTANVVGTQANHVLMVGVASRAFQHGGRVYAWLVFAGESSALGPFGGIPLGIRAQLQNAYYLYRDDGQLISKAAFGVAGGFSPATGHLPGVVLTAGSGTYSWAGAARRVIRLGEGTKHSAFEARSPRDITFTFDDNSARRCARIGRTLYISGGLITQYDGFQLAELGFLIYPWHFIGTAPVLGGDLVEPGTYSIKLTMSSQNGVGEKDRSTTAAGLQLSSALTFTVSVNPFSLWVTLKTGRMTPAIEIWRTARGPSDDAPFFLTTSKDPTDVTNPNAYVANDPTIFSPTIGGFGHRDNFPEAELRTKEANSENGGVLEYLAPPGARIIHATDTRVILADVAGDADRVWPSRLRVEGEVASFHDSLPVPVPPDGGRITAIAFLNETMIVFRETAIYSLPGQGLDNTGGGTNFGPATRLSSDVGAVSMESVGEVADIGLIFKSRKGWYLLERGGGVRYVGAAVAAFDGETVRAVHTIETQHQVRILTSGRILMWDYHAVNEFSPMGVWSDWTVGDGIHATMWNGQYVYLTETGPKVEPPTFTGLTYGMDVETGWIKMADLQGAARVWCAAILGEWRSPFIARIRVARDYQYAANGDPAYYDDVPWVPDTTTVGNALQVKHYPKQGACEAIKVRFTAIAAGATATLATATALSQPVITSGSDWASTWNAVPIGEYGNAVTMSVAYATGATGVDVREHFAYDTTLRRWREDLNNIGVLITGTPTVAQLEAAIVAGTSLATLATPDPTPGKVIDPTPRFVSAGTAVTSRGSTITLATPAGVVPGDTLLVFAYSVSTAQSDMTTSNLPAGWSLLSRVVTAFLRLSVLARRTVVAGEPATHVFPMTSTGVDNPLIGVIVAYRGLDITAAPVAASAVDFGVSTTATCPGLTLTAARDLYLGWVGVNSSNASATCPVGSVERVDQGATQDGFNRAVVFDIEPGAAGPTGSQAVTLSISEAGIAAAYALASIGATVGSFSGGTFSAPTGEACKLTGLSLEVGLKPGLHRRLSAEQKV